MKRLTTNCPDNNIDAALNMFYIKDSETWVRGGGDGPDYPDIRLYDFIRKAAKILLDGPDEAISKGVPFKRIVALMEADRAGRLVVQPCKMGDILYRVFAGEIFEHRVGSMKYFAIQGRWDIETYPFCPCVESSIGKTVFLTHEEAERALEAKKDE